VHILRTRRSVWQCVAVCGSVWQCVVVRVAVRCSVLQCGRHASPNAHPAHVLQCVAECGRAVQCLVVHCNVSDIRAMVPILRTCCNALQCVAVRCNALQCGAVRCSVLQCGRHTGHSAHSAHVLQCDRECGNAL